MGGKDNDYNYRNEVIQLNCPDAQIHRCQWKEVGNLQFERSSHVSFALPESYDICTTTRMTMTTTTTTTTTVTTTVTTTKTTVTTTATTTDKTAQQTGIIAAFSVLVVLFCSLLAWKFAIVPKMPWFYR